MVGERHSADGRRQTASSSRPQALRSRSLAAKGLSCPTPVRDLEGANLRELAGRPAALVTFLEGVWHRHPEPQ